MKMIFPILTIVLLLHSCSSSKKMSDNQTSKGHFRLYTYPLKEVLKPYDEKRYQRVVIISSNDFNGNIEKSIFPIPNRFGEKREMHIGGAAAIKSYLNVLRSMYADQTLYVDAGSLIDPNQSPREELFIHNYLDLDVWGLGMNELSYAQRNHKENSFRTLNNLTKSHVVNSNLTFLVSDNSLQKFGIRPSTIKQVNGLKVGFVSVLTRDLAKNIQDKNIDDLHIESPTPSVIQEANRLRKNGAQIVILMANKGLDCSTRQAKEESLHPLKVNFFPKQSEYCNTDESKLYDIIYKLPPKTVDLVLTSGGQGKVVNYIQNIPVVQTPGQGRYLAWSEIFYDKKHQKVNGDKTRIHQPVELCHQFLKDHQDCFVGEGLENKELMPAFFLGKQIKIDKLPRK